MKKRLAKIILAVLSLLPVCAQATVVDITVATDKPTYQLGEYVTVSVTAYNPNPEPVTLYFIDNSEVTYIMDNTFDLYGGWVFIGIVYKTISAYDSYT